MKFRYAFFSFYSDQGAMRFEWIEDNVRVSIKNDSYTINNEDGILRPCIQHCEYIINDKLYLEGA